MSVNAARDHLLKTASRLLRSNGRRQFSTSVTCMREKERWTQTEETLPVPKGEWVSFFHYFAPKKGVSVDLVLALQKPINFSYSGIKEWFRKVKEVRSIADQTYLEDRVSAVGCELAAAHFLVHRGGKVLPKGSSEWIEKDEDGEYNLPRFYTPEFFVERLDASGTALRYEGLECIGNLEDLKWLNLSKCTEIDNWCIDRLCGQFAHSLEYLNISFCPNISEQGFAALSRLRKLKTLDVTGLDNINNVQLMCLLIEEVIPDINIIGINYMESPMLEEKCIRVVP